MSTRRRRGQGGVTYDDVTGTLRERTVKAMRDPALAANLRTAGTAWAEQRQVMEHEYGFNEMRDRARDIRRSNIRELPALLTELQHNVRANGGTVVRAADAAEACRYIVGLARARGARTVAKSKSMATEEIKLNDALEDAGLEVVETDLGEWILQLANEHPTHIIARSSPRPRSASRASTWPWPTPAPCASSRTRATPGWSHRSRASTLP